MTPVAELQVAVGGPSRVLIFGDFRGKPDEGLRGISQAIARGLGEHHQVMTVTTRDAFSPETVRNARRFEPAVLHYVTGPTIRSLAILAVYRRMLGGQCATVASAVRPWLSPFERRLAPALRPDLVLSQSMRWERYFRRIGVPTRFVPNGTQTARFRPVGVAARTAIRRRYQLPLDRQLVLHVGHIKQNRNLDALVELQRGGFQTVMVGGTAMPHEPAVEARLIDAGCIVIHRYIDAIEDLYACADCYVFPVPDPPQDEFPSSYNEIGVIDCPLSVLEAMSCNLPVLTTRFGALPRMFAAVPGLHYYDGMVNLCTMAGEALAETRRRGCETRAAVLPYDWSAIHADIAEAHESVRAGRRAVIPAKHGDMEPEAK